jgi:hypothetical protein
MYKLLSLQLRQSKFIENLSIDFKNQFTAILGKNCTSKTSIAKALVFGNYIEKDAFILSSSGELNEASKKFIYFGEEELYGLIEQKGNYEIPNSPEFLKIFEKALQKYMPYLVLKEFFPAKILDPRSIIQNLPLASGEKILLTFILIHSIRKFLKINAPIIIDGITSYLDLAHMNPLYQILRDTSNQVIIFSYPDSRAMIREYFADCEISLINNSTI